MYRKKQIGFFCLNNQTLAKESYQYDVAGNRTVRIVTLYQDTTPLKEIATYWEYDLAGHMIKQIESGDKITKYAYDCRGNLIEKMLPSGLLMTYTYDGIGRITELKSFDQTVHYCYRYLFGSQPTEIQDLVTGSRLIREYNSSGQLLSEINPYGLKTQWNYDEQGHCIKTTLPDNSQIAYIYAGSHLSSVERRSKEGAVLYAHHYLDFDPNGHVCKESLIHAGVQCSQRDELERPLTQHSPWLTQTLSYGPSGLVKTQTNSLLGDQSFTYDFLSQLIQENEDKHPFDSLGNPLNCQINDRNELLATPYCNLDYDPDGNLKQKKAPEQTTHYNYDALGRLRLITTPDKETLYEYDPLSRLISKTIKTTSLTTQVLYLHDHQNEIGTCSQEGTILELKVLGLGIQGDVGAAIAIEIGEEIFAPLHDFNGHIIALVAKDGSLHESTSVDAFGRKLIGRISLNPWCFSSKRQEGNLIYFGHRFYDLDLGRWLTPDPAGFVDSPNLYLYVLNNPLNRLDLFGLSSELINDGLIQIDVLASQLPKTANTEKMVTGTLKAKSGVTTDFFIIGSNWHLLHFSAEELQATHVDLSKHFLEMFAPDVPGIQLITVVNGVNTTFAEAQDMGWNIRETTQDVSWIIGTHNPTVGPFADVWRAGQELINVDTPATVLLRQFLVATARGLDNINPKAKWLHESHSEGGLQTAKSIQKMTPDEQALMHNHMISLSFAPARPISKKYTVDAINVYSNRDLITGPLAKPFLNDPNYDIRFVKPVREGNISAFGQMADVCMETDSEAYYYYTASECAARSLYEHGFLNPTLQGQLIGRTQDMRNQYGFYNGQIR